MSRALKAWNPERVAEPESIVGPALGLSAKCAAEEYAQELYWGGDRFDELTVHVRMDDGSLRVFTVEAEPSVDFSVFEEKSP